MFFNRLSSLFDTYQCRPPSFLAYNNFNFDTLLINYETNYKTTNYKKKWDGLGQWVTCNDMAIQKHLFELYMDFK
jgi:hypothetical protein